MAKKALPRQFAELSLKDAKKRGNDRTSFTQGLLHDKAEFLHVEPTGPSRSEAVCCSLMLRRHVLLQLMLG